MNLPQNFEPAEHVEIGSNVLINGKVLVAIETEPILLIGKGVTEPRVWLATPGRPKRGAKFVVEDNESCDPSIRVLIKGGTVSVYLGDRLVLQAVKQDAVVNVTHLDLLPLGLTISADLTVLKVGNQILSNNTFQNVETMVGIG